VVTDADDRLAVIEEAVASQVQRVMGGDAFRAWREGETLRPGDFVVINNSFLFREGRGTNKSDRYLTVSVGDDGEPGDLPQVVSLKTGINVQFKRVSVRQKERYTFTNLAEAAEGAMYELGRIIFCLVGRIGSAEPTETAIAGVSGVTTVRFVPDQLEHARLEDGVLSVNSLDDLNDVWSAVRSAVEEGTVDLEALGGRFEATFHSLQEGAGRPVDPRDVPPETEDAPSILGGILARMEEQQDVYKRSLGEHQADPSDAEIYNELLRVAYNFADGARGFLALTVGICDLKPLLSWLTVFEQVELAHRFSSLPFSLVGKAKPSLERYRAVIANARNQAFHDLFAFDHPFRVRLSDDAIRAPELWLFREYLRRGSSTLDYEDRELVELFDNLTRTAERPVPVGFWEGNETVMAAVVDVARSLKSSLILTNGV
jgi:hypothetical protein